MLKNGFRLKEIKENDNKMQGMTQHWILTCYLGSAPLVCGQSNLG